MRLGLFRRRFSEHDADALESVRFVVLDTELTSLDTRSNRLLSVGAIAMRGPRILLGEQFYKLVNPGIDIPKPGVLIHGLTPGEVEAGDDPAAVLEELAGFVGSAVLVGHFVAIDLKVLAKELAAAGRRLTGPAIDTARVQSWLLRQRPKTDENLHAMDNLDLISVARSYGLEVAAVHHALGDAFLTARLWQRMIYALQSAGIRTLGEALRIGHS